MGLSIPPTIPRPTVGCSAWPSGVACIGISVLTFILLRTYSLLHWQILHHHFRSSENLLRNQLLDLLGQLEIYRVTGLIAAGFCVWPFRGSPRWLRWVTLPFGEASLLAACLTL
jgi:hypothetical protein